MVRVTGSRVLFPFVIVVLLIPKSGEEEAKKDAFKREISKCFMDATEREGKKAKEKSSRVPPRYMWERERDTVGGWGRSRENSRLRLRIE